MSELKMTDLQCYTCKHCLEMDDRGDCIEVLCSKRGDDFVPITANDMPCADYDADEVDA